MKDYSKAEIKKTLAESPTRALTTAAKLIAEGYSIFSILEWLTSPSTTKRKEWK